MLDVCLLGTGGMMPIPGRWLTALMTRFNGSNLLIDCGEGTQITLKKKGWSFKAIDTICFTHYHGDHIAGLPGLLLTMGNSDRTETLTMIGPKGLERVVTGLRVIVPELPFEINYIELQNDFETYHINGYQIEAYKVNHSMLCYGYNLIINRAGKFNVDQAEAADIPIKYWSKLQKGETVEVNGKKILPESVMGTARKSIKLAYCTDTRPTKSIVKYAAEADLFICEGMYGDPDEANKSKLYKHMTFWEAAKLAKEAEVTELWLTHYGPALIRPKAFVHVAKAIFPTTVAAKDRQSKTLKFLEE